MIYRTRLHPVISYLFIIAGLAAVGGSLVYVRTSASPAPGPRLPAPAASAIPPRDRNSQPPAPRAVAPDAMATTLVLPSGAHQDIDFAHAIAVGDELATTYPTAHVWRVTRIRFELFETYTARLLYVEDLRP